VRVPEGIARLAAMERCEAVVRHICQARRTFEPQNPFWTALLELLPGTPPIKPSVVPHPNRFAAMTGITRRGVGTVVEWIRPALGRRTNEGLGHLQPINRSNGWV
jgi:hypothetical protein